MSPGDGDAIVLVAGARACSAPYQSHGCWRMRRPLSARAITQATPILRLWGFVGGLSMGAWRSDIAPTPQPRLMRLSASLTLCATMPCERSSLRLPHAYASCGDAIRPCCGHLAFLGRVKSAAWALPRRRSKLMQEHAEAERTLHDVVQAVSACNSKACHSLPLRNAIVAKGIIVRYIVSSRIFHVTCYIRVLCHMSYSIMLRRNGLFQIDTRPCHMVKASQSSVLRLRYPSSRHV